MCPSHQTPCPRNRGRVTPDNRVLKAAVAKLLSGGQQGSLLPDTIADLCTIRNDLRAVAERRLDARLLGTLPHGPLGRRYRTVRFIARLLAAEDQPDAEGQGDWAMQLVQDARRMRRVFERFVFRYAGSVAPQGTRVRRPRYPWDSEATDLPIDARVPILQPDAVLVDGVRTRVVECKYTPRLLALGPHDTAARFRSAHLQQIFCYLAREGGGAESRSGLLLYPQVGEPVRAEFRLGSFPVTLATLDLRLAWSVLCDELGALLYPGTNGGSY
ncbi:MAG: hypothetical protein WBO45_24145 [Planctomycetota bacterium]